MFYSYKLDDKIFANVFYVEKSLRSNTDGDKKTANTVLMFPYKVDCVFFLVPSAQRCDENKKICFFQLHCDPSD